MYARAVNRRLSEVNDPITLIDAIVDDGVLSHDELSRLVLDGEEIEAILGEGDQALRSLPNELYKANARELYPDVPVDEAYDLHIASLNDARARLRLVLRTGPLKEYVHELYKTIRSFNPPHFLFEKGICIVIGEEPVLVEETSQIDSFFEVVAYVVVMKGTEWVLSMLRGAALAPLEGGASVVGRARCGRPE